MEKARRRHVPAFGEWNYYSSSPSSPDDPAPPRLLAHSVGAAAAAPAAAPECWWFAPEPEACSDAWFRYSPPPRRPPAPKKPRRVRPPPPAAAAAAQQDDDLHKPCGGRARAAAPDAGAVAARARRVVRPVDADLYRVPPPADDGRVSVSSSRLPRPKRAPRGLWMGCLGLNCVA